MRLSLRLSPSLQMTVNGKLEIELEGETIKECFMYGIKQYPELQNILMKDDVINPNFIFFHNDVVIKDSQILSFVNEGDVLDVIPAIEAG